MSKYAEHQIYSGVNTLRKVGLADEVISVNMKLPLTVVRAVPLPRPNVQRQRSIQHMQLQIAVQKLMPKVEAGDRDAILTLLKVQQREANLLGLDAPKEVISTNFSANMDIEGFTVDQLRELTTDQLKAHVLRSAARGATDAEPINASPADSAP